MNFFALSAAGSVTARKGADAGTAIPAGPAAAPGLHTSLV